MAAAVVASLAVAPPVRAEEPDPAPSSDDTVLLGAGPAATAPAERPPLAGEPAPPLPEDTEPTGTLGAVVETPEGLQVVEVDGGPDEAAEVEDRLERQPVIGGVVDVFVDQPATIAAWPDLRDELWNLDALGIDQLPGSAADGSDQIVAVLDTGVRASHPDLRGRVNCDIGADFSVTSHRSVGNGCSDPHGHGTHVAGIVSAVGDDGAGVAGVSAAQIMPVRVMDANGGGLASRISAGIIWAVDNGATVINLSIVSEDTAAFDAAIAHALANDVVVVAAAGNNRHLGNAPQAPASRAGVISVAATDELGLSAPYSYSGASVSVAAPGDLVLSTTPSGHDYSSGTSMAAPHVAGVVARYREKDPTADVGTIRSDIESTAIDIEVAGQDPNTGHGLIDVGELLTGVDTPADPAWGYLPGAPRNVVLTPGASSVTLSWDQPQWTGALPIDGYAAFFWRVLGGELVEQGWTPVVSETELTVGGLANGATFVAVVVAVNSDDDVGQFSMETRPATTRTVPLPPQIGKPSVGSQAARVRWSTANNQGSPVTGYVVKAYQGWRLVKTVTVPASARDVRISGLTNGRAHTFLVQAVNAVGTSRHSARSVAVTPHGKPGAPRVGKPAAADDAARVYWAAPTQNGGAYISAYVIKVYQGSKGIKTVTVSGAKRSTLITGLRNRASYTFTVTAKTRYGFGRPTPRSPTVRTR